MTTKSDWDKCQRLSRRMRVVCVAALVFIYGYLLIDLLVVSKQAADIESEIEGLQAEITLIRAESAKLERETSLLEAESRSLEQELELLKAKIGGDE